MTEKIKELTANFKKNEADLEFFKNKNCQNEQKIMELLEENENIIIKTTEDIANKTPRPNLRPVSFFVQILFIEK